eukprot:TRINITY_DN84179_c0_g1_i1.p2 TRINITY_DN84179_c0_g1~~TRINITY_DN84179_c0_g1_i1.p2  ORF type:complete len:658 (-),score=411.56 TRINITY_DN84179_c0_g1_i1:43-2016(-)
MSDSEEEQEVQYAVRFGDEGDDAKEHPFLDRDGAGVAKFPNGDTYEGEYRDGKRNGKGKYVFAKGGSYEGDYVDGLKHGRGVLITPDGGRYEGEFQNDKRHGQGRYEYKNGDVYEGGWMVGLKHGQGTYFARAKKQELTGMWQRGKCLNGVWKMSDGTQYVGQFADNKPRGKGVFVFPSGHAEAGEFAGKTKRSKRNIKWIAEERVDPAAAANAVPPEPVEAPPIVAHERALSRSVMKRDHFEGIYRIDKKFEGAPNWRKIDGFPVFGSGQPTLEGFDGVLTHIRDELELENVVWVCMRQEPIVYVNNWSYGPRHKFDLNNNMHLTNTTASDLKKLNKMLKNKVLEESKVDMKHHYWRDTYAENPVDRVNTEYTDDVANDSDVRSLEEAYSYLVDEKEHTVELVRIPIADERTPSVDDFQRLLEVVKDADDGTAFHFNCQMGKGRTTVGMVIACLVHRAIHGGDEDGGDEDEDEDEDEDDDEDEDIDEDELDEDELAELQAKRAAKAERKRQKEEAEAKKKADELAAQGPQYKFQVKGEYAVIEQLVAALGDGGAAIKNEVDDVITRAEHIQNLRGVIWYTKTMFDKETPERRGFWREMAVNFVERYFNLILFNAYVHAVKDDDFEPSYADWLAEHKDYVAILGSRDEGALKDFNWE